MQKISSNYIITNILTTMSKDLDDSQMRKLKNTLFINFADVEISKSTYELAESVNGNDLQKIQYFEAAMKIKKLSDKSIDQYTRAARLIREYWGKNFADITPMEIEAYLARRQQENKWKDTTLKNNINYLRTFYAFLKKKDLIKENPMEKIDGVKLEKREKETFSIVELEKMRNVCKGSARD